MSRWQVRLTPRFVKELASLDKSVQHQVIAYLDAAAALDDPRQKGKALVGELRGYWRYRIGDYRLIAIIEDAQVTVIAHLARRLLPRDMEINRQIAQNAPKTD